MKKLVPAFLTFILFFCGSVHASTLPDRPSSRVSDTALMFSAAEREKLEAQLAAFEKETSNQLVVVTVQSLEGLAIEDYSIKLAEKWKIGTKEHDNGIILLFSKEDRAMRIEVGYGLEGALPDALAKRIIENEVVPRFKQGDFDGGVGRGVDAIIQATRGEYKSSGESEDGEALTGLVMVVLFLYFVLPIVSYFLLILLSTAMFQITGFFVSVVIVFFLFLLRRFYLDKYLAKAATYSGTGRGGHYGGSSFGGGGFGGGGGGSFGGGGASGRW